MDKDHLDVLI